MNDLFLSAFADESSPFIDGQIEAMQKNGIKYLEIRNVDKVNISKIDCNKAKEVRNKMDAAGLKVWSMGSPFGKINIKDDFAPHLENFKKSVEIATILGAKNFRLFSFYADEYTPAVFSEVCERMNGFSEAAKGSGITICHENEKGIYGDVAPRCLEIHKALPDIKCVFDPANYVQCHQDTIEAWQLLKNYVHYLHIKDSLENGQVVPAGKGIGNLEYIIGEYKNLGKSGVMTIEPHLKVFKGLEGLEGNEKTVIDDYSYPTNEVAFEAACSAVKDIIAKL